MSPRVTNFWKSVNVCRSYGQLSTGLFLWNTVYISAFSPNAEAYTNKTLGQSRVLDILRHSGSDPHPPKNFAMDRRYWWWRSAVDRLPQKNDASGSALCRDEVRQRQKTRSPHERVQRTLTLMNSLFLVEKMNPVPKSHRTDRHFEHCKYDFPMLESSVFLATSFNILVRYFRNSATNFV